MNAINIIQKRQIIVIGIESTLTLQEVNNITTSFGAAPVSFTHHIGVSEKAEQTTVCIINY